ncbi:hypothetical protein M427DRAFT_364338 [Gonapodya prolifera JEL478]|uniref:HTH La-type RNA-binding domain-containing protein n=1 Tax=Gonapodya prolifera (strain JEL478) TaxID=1344416 RepID=A0A139A9R2_GONPJ|nr:hypothetical protein M427DRAFT_364338 [Gonapodya prolifera JEL478]|eukprot:KXS13572.1 hypothetical protein M427DRAFT_364338 [Gonapodya prolifera JEL478]
MDPPASDQSASASAPAPEPPHRVLERRIARRMVSYFSPDCGLDFDWWLLERAAKDEEGWIPIADFTSTYMRLQSLTDDEAVVAKAVRQFADNVEVSNDGKRVRSREKLLNPADPHPDDERTVYVERLPSVQKTKRQR